MFRSTIASESMRTTLLYSVKSHAWTLVKCLLYMWSPTQLLGSAFSDLTIHPSFLRISRWYSGTSGMHRATMSLTVPDSFNDCPRTRRARKNPPYCKAT
ncbi:hypothetical protein GBAR_LOCUS16497 [Geodia barretti]|uniref:Uncharacterized protein n=1 Tax=Geodia barretti TaxID=519541 RepID=A0AA35WU36_GEOBA|nr:hypothetical protein GBAR_LOCUS16497 [Geodia barretti]